jgi:predicted AAA+ superfamily ATPase
LRINIHQEYFNAIVFRDLVERHDIAHPRAVQDLAHWLANHIGSLYTINSLTGYLKSLGHKAPKSAVSGYLEWFEDAYLFFKVRIFDPSLAHAHANPKKIYCVDHALVQLVGTGILVNSGHLLEDMVFCALRRVTSDIFYYRTRGGRRAYHANIANVTGFKSARGNEARQCGWQLCVDKKSHHAVLKTG